MKKLMIIFSLISFVGCGGSENASQSYAFFKMQMSQDINNLTAKNMSVKGYVSSKNTSDEIVSKEASATFVTSDSTSDTYSLPVSHLNDESEYTYHFTIYYQAGAVDAPSVSSSQSTVAISTNSSSCPSLSLSPDTSLSTDEETGDQWLALCTIEYTATYSVDKGILIPETAFTCETDADGDGSPNLTELSFSYDPYNGDYDGDCVADGADAFPTDEDESLDTDGDNVGDNSDLDADGDGIYNITEIADGTDPLKEDTDGDSILDDVDNCPLLINKSQNNVDDDGVGDACDDDADNDGLSDADETTYGTNSLIADSDEDGLNDGDEVSVGTNPLTTDFDEDGSVDGDDAFPLDGNESKDTDGDGIGDNSDNCVNEANSENLTDTDNDGQGDVCDSDDDNDGLSDTLENKIGSNALDDDTDDDGANDRYGHQGNGTDKCLRDASVDVNDLDDDGDGIGNTCDLSDNLTLDPSASAIDFVAIFVDSQNGNDTNDGKFARPVLTLEKAMELAKAAGKDVYASGTFTLTSTLELVDGVMLYGGFDAGFNSRDPLANPSIISSTTLPILVLANGLGAGSGLNGFNLTSSATSGSPVGLAVLDSQLTVKNSQIHVSGLSHAIGVQTFNAQLNFSANSVDVSGGTNTGRGIELDETTGDISSNSISVQDYGQRVAVYCVQAGETDITFNNNTLDVWNGTASLADASFDYLFDCQADSDRIHYSLTLDYTSWDGFLPVGNILDGLF